MKTKFICVHFTDSINFYKLRIFLYNSLCSFTFSGRLFRRMQCLQPVDPDVQKAKIMIKYEHDSEQARKLFTLKIQQRTIHLLKHVNYAFNVFILYFLSYFFFFIIQFKLVFFFLIFFSVLVLLCCFLLLVYLLFICI